MTDPQDSTEVVERIRRVEHGLWRDPLERSQSASPTTLAERMEFYRVPGVSVAVINDGEIAWARGYGVLEAGKGVPVDTNTIFQACSISKHVAAVGVLRLVKAGMLDLDADVNDHLTNWKIPANGAWKPIISVRHVLNHTAGLTYDWYRGFRRDAPIPTLLDVLEGRVPANTRPVRVVMLPGSRFRYSGSHFSVLQQLMVDVTRQPFPALMQELVFVPLGMANSSFDQRYPDTRVGTAAVGHGIGGTPIDGKWRVIPEMAGAGLWTTPTDLARIALEIQRAYTGASAFLDRGIVEQALTPPFETAYGLGTQLWGSGALRRFGHGGSNIGYRCRSTAYVEHATGAVIMTNGDDGDIVRDALLDAIAHEYRWPDHPPRSGALHVAPHTDGSFDGIYELRPDYIVTVRRQGAALSLEIPAQPSVEFVLERDATFYSEVVNSELSFTYSKGGEIDGLVLRQESLEVRAKKRSPADDQHYRL